MCKLYPWADPVATEKCFSVILSSETRQIIVGIESPLAILDGETDSSVTEDNHGKHGDKQNENGQEIDEL